MYAHPVQHSDPDTTVWMYSHCDQHSDPDADGYPRALFGGL
jgi:hypothetical protein